MRWKKPDYRQAKYNRLGSLGHGLGAQDKGWRLDEGAHTGFKLGSQKEKHHRKNVTPHGGVGFSHSPCRPIFPSYCAPASFNLLVKGSCIITTNYGIFFLNL